jgi:hypothetical protein
MTGTHVWLRDFELPVLLSALSQRESHWLVEQSRARRAGDDQAVNAAAAVLNMLDALADKLDRATERVA